MNSKPVSIIRMPTGIVAHFVARRSEFVPPGHSNESDLASVYESGQVPIERVRGTMLPASRQLTATYKRLAGVRNRDTQLLVDALTVILGSVPAFQLRDTAYAFAFPPAAEPFKPTAAHPRGYRGTKHRPPKPASTDLWDARVALCSRKQSATLFRELWNHRAEAVSRLPTSLGLPEEGLVRLVRFDVAPGDPFIIVWNPGAPPTPRLNSEFVQLFLYGCKGLTWAQVARLQGLCERLVFRGDKSLTPLICWLLQRDGPRSDAWLQATELQPPEHRRNFLALALESNATQIKPPRAVVSALSIAPSDRYRRWSFASLAAIANGVADNYVAAGLRLAAEHDPSHGFWRLGKVQSFSPDVLEQLLVHVPTDSMSALAMSLWEAYPRVPDLQEHLRGLRPEVFSPDQLRLYLRFLAELRWDDEEEPMAPDRWREIARCLPAIQEMLQTVPEPYTDQASNDLGLILGSWRDPATISRALPEAVVLIARLAAPPMNPDGNMAYPLSALLEVERVDLRQRLLSAPQKNFVRLDKVCTRKNDSYLLTRGLRPLLTVYSELATEGFEREPATLFRVAKLLGAFSWDARLQILRLWKSRLRDLDARGLDIGQLVSALDTELHPHTWSPVPKVLREYLAGSRQLTLNQIERHRQRIEGSLTKVKLLVLETFIMNHLSWRPGRIRRDPHLIFALQLLRSADSNKRGFRRFLKAYLAGDMTYLRNHPATRRWWSLRPGLNADRWHTGIKQESSVGGKRITLCIEQDPLEILKMGSYVGSCLGLGGDYSFSAIAVLLDANKQVVYARDEKGVVIARQLIAISSDNKLVPFPVYPEVSKPLQDAFRDYDKAFAAHMGMSLELDNYEIDLILAQDWWDDGAWNNPEKKGSSKESALRQTTIEVRTSFVSGRPSFDKPEQGQQ